MREWTPSQNDAINARNRNILVSAAAGSGKTAVLVERVIKMITDVNNPVDIDSLLIVTFTNAAAAEMKYKISKALNECIINNKNASKEQIELYKRQLTLLPNAQISTIDSFCNKLAKTYFYEIGINQDFSIIDESQLQLIEDKVISEVIENLFESGDEEIVKIYEQFAKPGDDRYISSFIKQILTYIYAEPFPYKWLKESIELYNPEIPFKESVWYEYISNEINSLLELAQSLANKCLNLFVGCNDNIGLKLIDTIKDDITLINSIRKRFDKSWDECYECYSEKPRFAKAPPSTKFEDQEIIAQFKSMRDTYKSIITSDIMSFFITDEKSYYDDMKACYSQLNAIFKLVKSIDDTIMVEKHEINLYSFNDILHFVIDLLFKIDENGAIIKTDIANDLTNTYSEIFVDEYQDTNEAQDLLFTYLSNGKNLFTVGDIKQSIYRFRLAMPNIFNQKKNEYIRYDKNDNCVSSKIILDKNFRSRKDICSFVNFVFSSIMSERVGELEYNSDEYLNYGANYDDTSYPSAQIKIINGVDSKESDEVEATYIANLIKSKIAAREKIKDGDNYREINYSDFTILLRRAKNHIDTYAKTLEMHNIPVVCDYSTNLFESNEIKILLSFIRTIDNPTLDVSLLATMMSPIYGFTPDEMAEIRIENRGKSLYTAVSNSKMNKAISFLADINRIRKISVSMSVSGFIRYLLDDKGLISLFNAMGNGEARYQNILKLVSFAKSFDNGLNVGLTAFIRYIDKIQKSDKGLDSPALTSVSNNSVKIMTVHHSKGLEFPICILAGAGRDYSKRELIDNVLFNTSYGVGIKRHNEELLCQYNTLPYLTIKNKISYEMMSENLRVLYVAITRAKEQFITVASVTDIEKKVNSLAARIDDYGKINPYYCKKTNSDSDFLLLCALKHNDAENLRSLVQYNLPYEKSDFTLDIEITDSFEFEIDNDDVKADFVDYDENILNSIKNKLGFTYDKAELSSLSSKLAASSLDRIDGSLDFLTSSMPAFLNKDSLSPAQRGTAMHTFMQYANYNRAKNNLDDEIEVIVNAGHLTNEEAETLNKKSLNALFNSDLMNNILSADKIYKEIKVSMFVSSKEIYDTELDEKILVQGIADLVIEKNGELTLIDYKTDNVKDEEELLARYEKQIMFYKKAIAKTLERPVKSALLYSFKLEKCCYYK